MKKLIYTIFLIALASCHTDIDDDVSKIQTTFNFIHYWDDLKVTNTDFNAIKYTNEDNTEMSIEKLRYLISKITFQKANGEIFVLDGYNLIDVTNNSNLSFTPTLKIPTGDYSNVSFIFGFNNDDNYNFNYPDLNATSWSVPEMLGGGYHYMQLEGKFINDTASEIGYAYHAIRAVDNSKTPLEFQNTFFEVNLGAVSITNHATFEIKMNIAEWFKNPNTWDLNTLHNMLMPNFNAQIMMFENGQNVFSLESITQ